MAFSVLFVCTGNICRSPMAERLFQARAKAGSGIVASSAGVNGLVGWSMDPLSAEVLTTLGGDPHGHVARRLEHGLITAADLILTAEGSHRAAVLQVQPLAYRRTFTFREFSRLGADLPPLHGEPTEQELRDRVDVVAARRGTVDPVEPGADDITDPFGAPVKVTRFVGEQVSEAVNATLASLGLAPGPSVW